MTTGAAPRAPFASAVIVLTVVRLASVVAWFGVNVLAARVLGPGPLAVIAVATTLATAASLLANPGLGIASVYFIVREPDARRAMIGTIASLTIGAGALAALLVVAVLPAAALLFFDGASPTALLAATTLAAGIVAYEVGLAILLGLNRRPESIGLEGLRSFGTLGLSGVVAVIAPSDVSFVLASAAATWLSAAAAWFAVRRTTGGIRPGWEWPFARRALDMGLRGQVGNFVVFLNLRLDFLLVPALLPLQAAGVYVVAVRVAEVVTQLANSVSSFLFPEVVAQEDPRATENTERVVRATLLAVVVASAVLALLAEPILAIAFGPEFVPGATALRITMLGMVALAVGRIMIGDLKGRGRAGLVSIVNVAAVILTVVLVFALVPPFGIIGAATASVAVYALTAAMLVWVYRQVTGGRMGALVPTAGDAGRMLLVGRRTAAASIGRLRRPGR